MHRCSDTRLSQYTGTARTHTHTHMTTITGGKLISSDSDKHHAALPWCLHYSSAVYKRSDLSYFLTKH